MMPLFGKLAWVALGGAIGSAARYAIDDLVSRLLPAVAARFPLGILLINTFGCLLFGLVCGISGGIAQVPEKTRWLVLSGLLGGFTTFSTFGHDTARLLSQGSPALAVLNTMVSLCAGVGAVFLGLSLGQRLAAG